MADRIIENVQTPIFLEINLLKRIIQDLKPFLLKEGARNFKENGSSTGMGSASVTIEFTLEREISIRYKYTTEKRNKRRRNQKRMDTKENKDQKISSLRSRMFSRRNTMRRVI